MDFKIDENLPVDIAKLLIKAGHDAITVNDQRLQGAEDAVLIKFM
jgi:predicted nuclease of predicted toxin-antitoxin system